MPAEMTGEQTAFWDAFCTATGHAGPPQEVIAFGHRPAMQDELAALVLGGRKRATAGLRRDYGAGTPLPAVGDLVLFHGSDGTPLGIWQTTDVRTGPLSSVTASFAWDEGEMDRSRDAWLAGHTALFEADAETQGFEFHPEIGTVFERFRLVWPPDAADR